MPPYIEIALGLIKRWEGFESEPYQDPTGTWTIGYGFTEGVTRKTPPMTREEADKLLETRLAKVNHMLDIQCFVPLSNHQRGALLSLAWNIGMGNLGRSTLLHHLNNGAYGAAAAQFLVWTYSKGIQLSGLHKRREAEMQCFNTKD